MSQIFSGAKKNKTNVCFLRSFASDTSPEQIDHCLISYRGGLGTSLCIMGYGTQHPHSRKEHTALYNISKFGVNQANIRKDTAIQKLQILLRNVWNAGRVSGVPYIS